MTNLIVSRRCNQKCSYCFAEDELSTARKKLPARQISFHQKSSNSAWTTWIVPESPRPGF